MNRSAIRLVSDEDAPLPFPEALQGFAAEADIVDKKSWKAPARLIAVHGVVAALAIIAVAEFALLASQFGARQDPAPLAAPVMGTVAIESTPPGVRFAIDGEERGTTPSALTLKPGNYALSIAHGEVSRTIPLVVRAGNNSERIYFSETGVGPLVAAAPTPAPVAPAGAVGGWISVTAPVDLQLFEGGVLIGSTAVDRIMLSTGRHVIDAVSTAVGYRTTQTVMVSAGSVTPLKLELPNGVLNLNATPWAEIAIDGKPVGTTPVANISLSVGSHDVVFRHPQLGERRQTIFVTLNGINRVSANLTQP